ncbi:MAG TPA: acyl carrier protein [Acetobacteraceae bacterium]|jgi:acyl carrier protein
MDHPPLLDLIAGTLGIPAAEISESSDMSSVKKWDSLRHVMLMTELETTYGIELSDREMTEATSVTMIRQILSQRGVG